MAFTEKEKKENVKFAEEHNLFMAVIQVPEKGKTDLVNAGFVGAASIKMLLQLRIMLDETICEKLVEKGVPARTAKDVLEAMAKLQHKE